VTFRLASEKKSGIREVTCPRCGFINQVNIGKYAGGVKTIFCKGCGEEIQLIYDRTLVGMELKRSRKEEA